MPDSPPLVNGKLFNSPGPSLQLNQNWTVRPKIYSCSAKWMIPLNCKWPGNSNQIDFIKVPIMCNTMHFPYFYFACRVILYKWSSLVMQWLHRSSLFFFFYHGVAILDCNCLLFCRMRYVAAYLLAVLGGNSSPSPSDIKEILESVGVTYDGEKADTVCNKLKGKDVNEVRNYSSKTEYVSRCDLKVDTLFS